MKKVIGIILMAVVMMSTTNAWEFDAFGYKIRYNQKETIDNTQEIPKKEAVNLPIADAEDLPRKTDRFNDDIRHLNNNKEIQLILKELDYRKIGFINIDSQKSYTILINQEGIINGVLEGLEEPEIIIRGSYMGISEGAKQGNIRIIKQNLKIPFKLKMKLAWMKVF